MGEFRQVERKGTWIIKFDLTTPALLFPAISLLLLAYTNRFLGLASVIRKLHADHQQSREPRYLAEIANLRRRVNLIRDMQTYGTASLLCCTVSMAVLFFGLVHGAMIMFSISLVLMAASLAVSIIEIRMSVGALDLHLSDLTLASSPASESEGRGSWESAWVGLREQIKILKLDSKND
jgi:hypothetical protein